MSDAPSAQGDAPLLRRIFDIVPDDAPPEGPAARFAEAALARNKREGMELALRARWIALAVIAVMLPLVGPGWEMLWFHGMLALLAVNGWLQRRVARVGRSSLEVFLIVADLAIMTAFLLLPNPLSDEALPTAMAYRFATFKYLLLFLAFATLAYHWRTVWGMGVMGTLIWLGGFGLVALFGARDPALSEATRQAFGSGASLADLLDPNASQGFIRVQEAVVMLLIAGTLATAQRRSARLLMSHAGLERERANLARYFSPNVVEELSSNDEPLKRVRTQNVAVLFVDIVGFTRLTEGRDPAEVIDDLREFHRRMETEVFRHDGTLDKYLGDGLMATFGSPVASERDAADALRCALAMIDSVASWNEDRAARGEAPIRASFGVHTGAAVLGDIGADRLEFAVIGETVNVASRVEALTRPLGATLAATDEAVRRARQAGPDCGPLLEGLERRDPQEIRGLDRRVEVWTLA
ncbi:MAG: adenylate/guanylate cyclase domain-containing protein [Pseudomonadota bacterium]